MAGKPIHITTITWIVLGISIVFESIMLNEEATKVLGFAKPAQAINQKIVFGGLGGQIVQVVGIVKNYHHESLKNSVQPTIFAILVGLSHRMHVQAYSRKNLLKGTDKQRHRANNGIVHTKIGSVAKIYS